LDIQNTYDIVNKKKRGIMDNPVWGNSIFKNKKKDDDIFALLKQVPIFSDLKPKEIMEVEKILHRRSYKKNEPS